MRFVKHILLIMGVLMLMIPASAKGDVPGSIAFQGVLTDDDGLPLTGTYSITFVLYTDTLGATAVWSQTSDVDVAGGFYTQLLDVSGVDFDTLLYIGIETLGSAFGPRQPLAAMPYALGIADGAVSLAKIDTTGAAAGQTIVFDGTTLGWDAIGGAGGVGETELEDRSVTLAKIDTAGGSAGDAIMHDGSALYWGTSADSGDITSVIGGSGLDGGGTEGVVTLSISDDAISAAQIVDSSVSAADIAPQTVVRTINDQQDHLRIVAGDQIQVVTAGDSIEIIAILSGDSTDSDWEIVGNDMYSEVPGDVGIGTAAPGEKLDVVGSIRTTEGFISTAVAGPPLTVSSTALVTDLNADLLDGMEASDLAASFHTHFGADITAGEVDVAHLPVGAGAAEVASGNHSHAAVADGDWTLSGDDVYHETGNVGIGNTAPDRKLDITVTSAEDGIDINNTGINSDPVIRFQLNGTTEYVIGIDDSDFDRFRIGVDNVDDSLFTIEGNTGDVGIGTDNPRQRLEVRTPESSGGIEINNSNSGSGDPILAFSLEGSETFTMGIDDSDFDKFKIGSSSLATNTYMTIETDGDVGIGTTNPSEKLAVEDEDDLGSSVDLLELTVGASSSDGCQIIEAKRGSNLVFCVYGDGDVTADGAIAGGGADFAEMIRVAPGASTVKPGDVMVIDADNPRSTKKSVSSRSTLVAGLYSTNPGFVASERDWDNPNGELIPTGLSEEQDLAGERRRSHNMSDMAAEFDEVPLAIVGIVPCKVSAENGPIRIGDLLVTSDTPGHAMRDGNPSVGTVLGKALDNLPSGTGVIKILLTLQ